MSRIKQASPALVISIIALVAALVVPAVAQVATKALSKRDLRSVRRVARFQANRAVTRRAPRIAKFQANKQITNRAPGLDVNSANTANQADNATTANGVRPVKVDFTAPDGTIPLAVLDEGGLRVRASCTSLGDAVLNFDALANDAVIRLDRIFPDGSVGTSVDTDFGQSPSPEGFSVATSAPDPSKTVIVNYRGASGTTVSGSLQMAEAAAAAQCVVSGTLFVG
jgi:hypothetical protein